jgi:hypothetical protein
MVDGDLRNDNLARKLAEEDLQHAVIARQSNPLSGRSSLHLSRPIAEVVGFKSERHKPSYHSVTPFDAGDYLRSIEPLIAIVLGCMRWKSAQAHGARRMIDEQRG